MGAEVAICEMCEARDIRYVHVMSHPNFEGTLDVGCVCAERMAEDYVRPREREKALRNAASRKGRWLKRAWRSPSKDLSSLKSGNFFVVISMNPDGSWGGTIEEIATGRKVNARRNYGSANEAKLAAFDGMIFLQNRRGWGNDQTGS
ncbi:hypothetical protein [Bradyrhizobium barranii]